MELFQKEKIRVRTLENHDNVLIAKWLTDPNVLQFYEGRDRPQTQELVNEKFYNREEDEVGCIVEFDGEPIGYIQFYPLDQDARKLYGYDKSEVIFGTDQFIGEVEYWNQGIGKLLVQSMVQYLLDQHGAEKIVMDPQAWNERAIRCYEKSGFKKIKFLPKHEYHEGEYRDCWLIEYNHLCT
ncbi:GNAT family N-acetyltransferase [Peribacillus alkalitolerans]|uniref:GNAT family N-acetyltransferase n=1 Tax=Peribacillus alkalitolerans TaxID=1550385 RepID=UPI0013D7C3BD|nr:GNAT family N-acetyltransferase [Peribacillus alkalitolerans]